MSTGKKRKQEEEEGGKDQDDSPLPKEVLEVAERIGLNQNVPLSEMTSFLHQLLGPDQVSKLKYQTYNIREIQSKMLRFAQKVKHANRRKKTAVLTSKERKKMFDISKSKDLRYKTFLGLHHLWQQYMQVLVKGMKDDGDQSRLLKADYHGAEIIVAAARNPDLVNIMGIVVQETKNMFRIIDQEDRILSIPKIGSMIAFAVNGQVYKVNGAYISVSPHQRSRLKFKVRRKNDQV